MGRRKRRYSSGYNRSHKRRYRVKPRFFVIFFVLICLVSGTVYWFSDDGVKEVLPITEVQLEQGNRIMLGARAYINTDLTYDDKYYDGGYPPDNLGVCTDVVWKGFMEINVDIKTLVDWDISKHMDNYKGVVSTPDPNIDFRLVPTLEVFFANNAQVLTTDVKDLLAWQPGDIVIFESSHVAIISDRRNLFGHPYVIQHGKDPAGEEDRLFAVDGMKISGHYRWK